MDKLIEQVARALAIESYNTFPITGLSQEDIAAFVAAEWPEYVQEANEAVSVVIGVLRTGQRLGELRLLSEDEKAVIDEARKFCDRQVSVNPNNGGLMAAVRKLNGGA
jgi:hypothetical protein